METLLVLIALAALVAIVLGLIKPGLVLPFLTPEKRSRLKAFGLYAIVFVLSLILLPIVSDKDEVDTSFTQHNKTEQQWYAGGSLHQSNISEWKAASHANKLATAADWVLVAPKIKALAQNSNVEVLKPFAQELVTCVNEATEGHEQSDHSKTAEIATMCMMLMGYLK